MIATFRNGDRAEYRYPADDTLELWYEKTDGKGGFLPAELIARQGDDGVVIGTRDGKLLFGGLMLVYDRPAFERALAKAAAIEDVIR